VLVSPFLDLIVLVSLVGIPCYLFRSESLLREGQSRDVTLGRSEHDFAINSALLDADELFRSTPISRLLRCAFLELGKGNRNAVAIAHGRSSHEGYFELPREPHNFLSPSTRSCPINFSSLYIQNCTARTTLELRILQHVIYEHSSSQLHLERTSLLL
jgi:hypothetical protein